MSLAKPLPALRQDLRELLVEDLPTALRALDELLPDGSEKKAPVTALRAAFNQLNRERGLGVIDHAAYALRLAQLSANFLSLLDTLTEADFEPPAAPVKSGPPEPKRGSVLYKIPRQMPLRKASLCTVRVAVDEEAIFDDLVLDDGVRLRKRVEVSDMMTAELLDLEGNVFQVTGFNDVRQRVRDTGYTQWLFRVTPLVEGEHQLMVKVSLMEFDPNTHEYVPRNVSILETVTIVTEAPAPSDSDDTPMRATGHQFSLGPTETFTASKQAYSQLTAHSPINRSPRQSKTLYAILTSDDARVTPQIFNLYEEAIIGRNDTCDIVIKELYVSRRHIRLYVFAGQVYVEDCGSLNKTFLDEQIIERPTVVTKSGKLRLHDICIRLELYGQVHQNFNDIGQITRSSAIR